MFGSRNGKPQDYAIELWHVDELKPFEGNPRLISDEAVEKIARSIREFGFNSPIVITPAGTIAAGHSRLKAARLIGLDRVPVMIVDLSEDEINEYRIADNKTAEYTGWDHDLLKGELLELGGLDATLTGFDEDDIDRLLEETEPPEIGDFDEEYEPPEPAPDDGTIRVRVSKETRALWNTYMSMAGDGDESGCERLDRLISCVDRAILAEMVEDS